MQQPQGFIDPQKPHFVCRLCCSLYKLKQTLYAWNQQLSQFLTKLGFTISMIDFSLFILHTAHYSVFLLVYVDDIILIRSPNAPFSHIFAQL